MPTVIGITVEWYITPQNDEVRQRRCQNSIFLNTDFCCITISQVTATNINDQALFPFALRGWIGEGNWVYFNRKGRCAHNRILEPLGDQ